MPAVGGRPGRRGAGGIASREAVRGIMKLTSPYSNSSGRRARKPLGLRGPAVAAVSQLGSGLIEG
jgi:hypothetical protein